MATSIDVGDEREDGGLAVAVHRKERGNVLYRAGRLLAAAAEYAEAIRSLDAGASGVGGTTVGDTASAASTLDVGAAVVVTQPNTSLRAAMVAYGAWPEKYRDLALYGSLSI